MKNLTYILLLVFLISCKGENEKVNLSSTDVWEAMTAIENSIPEVEFPAVDFNILDYGAVADSGDDNTVAFQKAIRACNEAGGGRVVVPTGTFHSLPIHLEDNVNLHLEKGSEILFSTDFTKFPIVATSYEGTELMNFSPLIYANNKKNIAITGEGVLNGQASNEAWWPWCGKDVYGWKEGDPKQHTSLDKLKQGMSEKGLPVEDRVLGVGDYLRPTFIEPYECENVLIQGVKIVNAPFWIIHPFKSTNVTVDGVFVESHGPNNDGCNPEYSKNVVIKNSTFNTGDDCIAIKAGRNEDGRRVGTPTENIVVRDCKMIDGHGGVVIGSEMSAGVKNVFVQNCEMSSPNLWYGIRIKTNTKRGGRIENLNVRNIKVGEVRDALLIVNLKYGIYGDQTGDFMPEVQNINLENIQVEDSGKYGVLIKGYKDNPVKDISLTNVTIQKVESAYDVEGVQNLQFRNTMMNNKQMEPIINN